MGNQTVTETKQREGVLVSPKYRLNEAQAKLIDATSRELLEDPGLLSYSPETTELFRAAGATIEDAGPCARVRVSSKIVDEALESAPSTVVLGARNPDNKLVLDATEPRSRFGSGSETNIWLDVRFDGAAPRFDRQPGSIARLCQAAHLCDNLENLDFFIRCVNIRDEAVTPENKDVNKFLASLNNITKHVQAGLTSLPALDDVVRLGRIVAGGEEAFRNEPVLSFIACVIKSPFQVVADTARTFIEVARRHVPIVISSCPMGGATGPFDEFGMVAQINAELLAGVTLSQLASPGAPVLYGAVPVRSRLDNLNDMYGAPEFVQYNLDCAQMAAHYRLPCYSTAGVGDVAEPGVQATIEKLMTLTTVPSGGAQYIHYAFGLLERTNVFCPEQAVLDDLVIGLVKKMLAAPNVSEANKADTLAMIREVMETDHKSYVYHLPSPRYEDVYVAFPFEGDEAGALQGASRRVKEIMDRPRNPLSDEVKQALTKEVPGILPQTFES